MAQGLAGSGSQRRYGTLDATPDVAFASGLGQGGLAGGGLAQDSQFSPTEFFNLCENITTNIYTINSDRKKIERELRYIGTEKDGKGLRDRVHVTNVSCKEVVSQTTKELARLSDVVRRGNKTQRLNAEKLREEFSQAVQDYYKIQKESSDKMKVHLLPSGPLVGPDDIEDDSEQLIAAEQRHHQQKLKQQELEFEAGMLEERAQHVLVIETDLLDINQIMRDISELVHQQGEMISSLEDNIENAHGNVETGRQELQKAANYQGKYRRKVLCLLMTALVVATILGVIIYLSVKR